MIHYDWWLDTPQQDTYERSRVQSTTCSDNRSACGFSVGRLKSSTNDGNIKNSRVILIYYCIRHSIFVVYVLYFFLCL